MLFCKPSSGGLWEGDKQSLTKRTMSFWFCERSCPKAIKKIHDSAEHPFWSLTEHTGVHTHTFTYTHTHICTHIHMHIEKEYRSMEQIRKKYRHGRNISKNYKKHRILCSWDQLIFSFKIYISRYFQKSIYIYGILKPIDFSCILNGSLFHALLIGKYWVTDT